MDKSELLKLVGKNVKNIRVSRGYSQVDLVGRIEGSIDTTNISRIESGRTNPTIYTLNRIAEALEVPLSQITDIIPKEN
ncbi:helix-turn-helix domain-containing protein [Pseudofulvibacter geojedonensis]|uniref:Helix-turn-helix domain-containing protein n=1 Tax=Pseudofulvibacter geojedonensis TaxID=1123758 RepID=A0ABW3I4H5_9FLAO